MRGARSRADAVGIVERRERARKHAILRLLVLREVVWRAFISFDGSSLFVSTSSEVLDVAAVTEDPLADLLLPKSEERRTGETIFLIVEDSCNTTII